MYFSTVLPVGFDSRARFGFTLMLFFALLGVSQAPEAGAATCRPAAAQARSILAAASDWGDLEFSSQFGLDDDILLDQGRLVATVETQLEGRTLRSLSNLGTSRLCISIVLDVEGDVKVAHHRSLEPGDLTTARALTYGVSVDLPEATEQILILVEEPASGLWGATIADDLGDRPRPGSAAIRLAGQGEAWYEVRGTGADRTKGGPTTEGLAAADRAKVTPTVVRLVPPRQQPVSGATRFDALVSTPAVAQVIFQLDGETVATRKKSALLDRPFAARIELDTPPRPQTLRAIAIDSQGREMGVDTLIVNEIDAPLRVRISEFNGDPASGSIEIAADLTIPAGSELDRIEVYRNQTKLADFSKAPIRTRIETPDVRPDDFIRVAAFLADGRSIDDVVLLAFPEDIDEVEVNLVELFVVASDNKGQPIKDLTATDFTIVHRGKEQPTQSFAYADDVTLLLGLVIDTSGSMRLVMHDTRRAAAKFLGTTVLPQDRAFLVDFDLQPRLLHPTTSDLPFLLRDLAKLEAEGETAMYDAIVFSMLQFDRQRGRKALVVLTDGDDHDSRFGPKYCVDLARETGVPIYIIGLGALDSYTRTYRKKDLRKTTSETGGRLYFVESLGELDDAYAQINAELRSQYSLSYYVDSDLDDDERREVEVRVNRPGATARAVVGNSQGTP